MSNSVAAATAKPVEVEGFFDRYFYTPLGGALTRALARTPLTPNDVSWLSVAAAIAAAVAYFRPSPMGAALGAGLFLLSGVLDSTDGQLARATGRTSELGETLDGFCDNLSFGAIYVAAALSFVINGHGSIPLILVLGLVAAYSHSLQSCLVDFEGQLLVHYVTGRGRVLREDPASLVRELEAARARGEGPLARLLRRIRMSYCGRQRAWLRDSVTLLELHTRHVAPYPDRAARFAEQYRAEMRPMLWWWRVLAPNSHTLGIIACGFAPMIARGGGVGGMGLALVFLYDVALNFAVPPLIAAQSRLDRRMAREIAAFDAEDDAMPAMRLRAAR